MYDVNSPETILENIFKFWLGLKDVHVDETKEKRKTRRETVRGILREKRGMKNEKERWRTGGMAGDEDVGKFRSGIEMKTFPQIGTTTLMLLSGYLYHFFFSFFLLELVRREQIGINSISFCFLSK